MGALIYALAINSFLIPSKLGEGGVTGLMTIFYYWIGFPPALTNLILNGILLFVGWKMLSKQTVLYTIVRSLVSLFGSNSPVRSSSNLTIHS